MHELAKTGRWLGGNTPTGYASESITSVNMNGKTTRACKLKIIPEEITLVKLIFDKFIETGSLTKTDEFLLSNGYTTKRGKRFTRFADTRHTNEPRVYGCRRRCVQLSVGE